MTSIETFYLIDFENVHEEGLNGADKLGAHDHVHFFSTRNAPKISFQILKDFNSAHLYSHEIPVGRQSLDMHLVSYLGYLISEHKNQKCRYVIVSQDTDYDNIISFWKEELGISDIMRQNEIAAPNKPQARKQSGGQQPKQQPPRTETPRTDKKNQLNTRIQREMSSANYASEDIGRVASMVIKHFGDEQFANTVHNELRKDYPEKYLELYKMLKPILSQFS